MRGYEEKLSKQGTFEPVFALCCPQMKLFITEVSLVKLCRAPFSIQLQLDTLSTSPEIPKEFIID
jgi:hypothetical protein